MTWPCLFMRRLGVPEFELSMRGIAAMISDLSGFSVSDLKMWSTSSMKPVDQARLAARDEAMWLMWNAPDPEGSHTGHRYSLPQIGAFMGGLHHTTVLTATRRHEKRMRSGLHTALVHTGIDWNNSTLSTADTVLSTGGADTPEVTSLQIEQAESVAA